MSNAVLEALGAFPGHFQGNDTLTLDLEEAEYEIHLAKPHATIHPL